MAFIIKDRVKEGTVTTGTGAFALGGAASTFEAFNTYMSNGDTAYYAVVHTASGVDEWEVGLGTFNTGNTLTRTTILSSSNSGNAVSFSSGTKDIFMTYPADRAVVEEPDRSVAFPAGISVTGNVAASGTIDGRDVAADGTKLDGIETAATADQTAAEIRTLVESATDSNVFTDTDHSKLNAIEASATADQTASEIRTLVESASDSNVFTDADHTKLNAIEAGATADQTAAEIKTLVGSATDSNVFTDADHTKLDGIETAATADQTKADIEGLGIDVPATNLTGTIPAARLSTATTQAESDDSTKIATTAYVVDKITTLIGGAPSTLNDLNELAAAINDDANYNTTLTTALATKLPLAGGTMTGDVLYNDSVKAKFGAGSDLEIYHDGSNSYITDNGTGNLRLKATSLRVQSASGNSYLNATNGGSVDIFHNNSQKLATTSTGIQVTGNIANTSGDFTLDVAGDIILNADGGDIKFQDGGSNVGSLINSSGFVIKSDVSDADIKFQGIDSVSTITALTLDMSDAGTATFNHDIKLPDNGKAIFGAGSDLQIYHTATGNHSIIAESGAGNLILAADNLEINNAANNANKITATTGGAVTLYHNNAAKIATTSTGIDVTGNVAVSGTVDGRDVATDGTKLDGIEANATGDQTNAEIRAAVEAATDSNVFTDADHTKLNGIEASANVTDTANVVAALTAGTNVSIASNGTISSTDTNTTYSVGDGGLTQKNFTTTLKSKLDGIASGAQVNVPTNLGSGTSTTDVTIVSSSGSNTTVPGATTSAAGVISAADKAKLDGVATGATANVGDITGVTAGTNLNGGGSSGGVTVNLDANITLTTVTATNFNTTSDRNTKKDITPIADAVRKVQQLGGYNFTFKDTDEKSSGVIAQEVQEVLPELVQEGDEGHLTVQYGNMVGLLIEAIKEQQTQIDELKEKLNG